MTTTDDEARRTWERLGAEFEELARLDPQAGQAMLLATERLLLEQLAAEGPSGPDAIQRRLQQLYEEAMRDVQQPPRGRRHRWRRS